jgi:enoyl-CoA hydratase
MTDKQLVLYTREGHIGNIILNRPEKRNSFTIQVWNALAEAVDQAEQDKEARVILVKGAGKSFCAGLDLSEENELFQLLRQPVDAENKIRFYRKVRYIQETYSRLEKLTRPTIAVIKSHCSGAGLELVLCCDIRLCETGTEFSLPEARMGFITDLGGLQRLPRVVGPAKAREIAYRAHRFGAAQALETGLANQVFPTPEALDEGAMSIAREIAANSPLCVQGAKEVFLYQERLNLEESLDYTAARSSLVVPSEDMFEAMEAFVQRRKPHFKGK